MSKQGRPTKYNAEFHPLLGKLYAEKGLIDDEIAKELNINRDTLYEWKNKYKEFSDAIKNGKKETDDIVEEKFLDKATGFTKEVEEIFQFQGKTFIGKYNKYFPPDTAAGFIWLKNRRPDKWRDKHEITGNNGAPLIVQIAPYAVDDVNDK